MADYKVTDTELTSIADAIRTKGGTQAQLEFPTGFVSAVNAIPTGGGGSGDYDRLEYIQSDGTQYIDLLYPVVAGDTIEFVMEMLTRGMYYWLFGSENAALYCGYQTRDNFCGLYAFHDGVHNPDQNTRYGSVQTLQFAGSSVNNLVLFAINTLGEGVIRNASAKLYYLRYNDNWYIPVKRKADNVVGLLDLTNMTLLREQAGANPFTAGPVVPDV